MEGTMARPQRRVRSVNATNTSFPAKADTVTEPAGDAGTATGASVIDLAGLGGAGYVPGKVRLTPYGTGDADDVFEMKVIGWRRSKGFDSTHKDTWHPEVLAHLVCTLGTATGVASGTVSATELYADTISVASAGEPVTNADTTDAGTVVFFSPADNTRAYADVPLLGCEKFEVIFDMTTNDPTGGNALYTLLC